MSKNFLLPTYLPITEWRALIDILLALADPRLAPFWIAALAEAWAIGGRSSPEQDRLTWALAALAVLNVALFWICIPYRTQQRFMLQALGLAAVPLARLLDRWRGLRVAAAALLILPRQPRSAQIFTADSVQQQPIAAPGGSEINHGIHQNTRKRESESTSPFRVLAGGNPRP